jgi:hypothetical protein
LNQDLYTLTIEDNGTCHIETYRIKTIRGGKVYACLVDSFTWGKKSTKHGDFGWLEPIDPLFRKSCNVGDKFYNLHTTKRAAWADRKNLDWIDDSDPEESKIREKIKRTIKGMLSKI